MSEDLYAQMTSIVEELVLVGIERGDGSGLPTLHRRLRALLEAPHPSLRARPRSQAGMDLERRIWTMALVQILLTDVRRSLVSALQAARRKAGLSEADNPWPWLDDDQRSARERLRATRESQVREVVVRACRRYRRTGRPAHLRETVQALEDGMMCERQALPYVLTDLSCQQEAECLNSALQRIMAPSAVCFLIRVVRGHIHQTTPSSFRQPGGAGYKGRALRGEQWLSREGWAVLEWSREWEEGVWFMPDFQAWYDEELHRARLQAEEKKKVKRARREADRSCSDQQQKLKEFTRQEPVEDPKAASTTNAREEGSKEGTGSDTEETHSDPSEGMDAEDRVTVHFVEDGLTALNRVWLRGMELTLLRGSPGWRATIDRQGNTWLEMSEDEQLVRRGKVYFRPGPWPGEPWPKEERHSYQKDYSREGSWEEDDSWYRGSVSAKS